MDHDKPSRERIEAALALKKHDRVPVLEFLIDPKNLSILCARRVAGTVWSTWEETRNLYTRFGFDLFPVWASMPYYEFPAASEEGNFKVGGLQSREDIERIAQPRPVGEVVRETRMAIEYAAEAGMGVFVFFFGPFTATYCGMGIDKFWMRVYEDPGFIEEAFDRANDYAIELMEALCELDLCMVLVADDVAFNNGLLLQPQMFRELWYPRMERLIAPARAKKLPIMLHNCGNWTDLLPLADELGFTAIEPLQPTCNDIYRIKKDYGDRFCILGNIDIAGVLAFGTPDEVRADVREHIDRLADNGGYVVHSSHSIVDAIPHENFLAMVDEARIYGRYS